MPGPLPKNNLPPESQPWAREIEARVAGNAQNVSLVQSAVQMNNQGVVSALAQTSQVASELGFGVEGALESANGKNTLYFDAVEPTPPTSGFKEGDTWFDTANDNAIHEWDGAAWTLVELGETAIADLAITNAKIANLDGGKIVANTITGNKLTATSIDGKTITGATFRTGPDVGPAIGGQGVVLDTAGLRQYNASGQLTGELETATGRSTFTGGLRTGLTGNRVEIKSASGGGRVEFYNDSGVSLAAMRSSPEGAEIYGSNAANTRRSSVGAGSGAASMTHNDTSDPTYGYTRISTNGIESVMSAGALGSPAASSVSTQQNRVEINGRGRITLVSGDPVSTVKSTLELNGDTTTISDGFRVKYQGPLSNPLYTIRSGGSFVDLFADAGSVITGTATHQAVTPASLLAGVQSATLSLGTGWSVFSASITRRPGVVQMTAQYSHAGAPDGSTIGTLPVGFRPLAAAVHPAVIIGSLGSWRPAAVAIATNGNITLLGSGVAGPFISASVSLSWAV